MIHTQRISAYCIILSPMFQGDMESDQPFYTFFMESLEQSIDDGVEKALAYFTMLPSSPIKDV